MKHIRTTPRAIILFASGGVLAYMTPNSLLGSEDLFCFAGISLFSGIASVVIASSLANQLAGIVLEETSPLELSEKYKWTKSTVINLFAVFFSSLAASMSMLASYILYVVYNLNVLSRIFSGISFGFLFIVLYCTIFFIPKIFFESLDETYKSKNQRIKALLSRSYK